MNSNENAAANPKKLGKLRGCALILFGFAIIILIFGIISGEDEDKFTDSRDDRKYKTVKIGSQIWMAENLNYDIPSSKCYDNNPDNCNKYGRLYDWETAMKACPSGWHLPSNKEWDSLYRFADGTSGADSPYESPTAGKYLKATSGWNADEGKSGNGEDKFGFAALPGGGFSVKNSFCCDGMYGIWWSSSESSSDNRIYSRNIRDIFESAGYGYDQKTTAYSVRCVKDN
ncbi:MAG: fibrobacter succinogenes major paralogous domain-containing protein [Fibromonadaceae bacterium]|jgi:uncharacterized protein (TIGR02145 family)|nr:fibrobacter succinogenes major paralogous domain-containing protein [Fibromonadaceae bacterium]